MGKFQINLRNEQFEVEGDLVSPGNLVIGDFNEYFQASLSYWSRNDYLLQWEEGLKRLLAGNSSSAIITSMYDPNDANFIFWWVFYVVGEDVFIQNHVLFMEDLEQKFDEKNLYIHIPGREVKTEDGERISEWKVNLKNIEDSFGSLVDYEIS